MRATFRHVCHCLRAPRKVVKERQSIELEAHADSDEDVERKGARRRCCVIQDCAAYFQSSAVEELGGSGVPAAIFNLANTIIGASITGLPFVASTSGIVPFLIFLTISALLGYATLCMLVTAASYVPDGKKDYQVVGNLALGPSGLKITAAATCLSCYGALTSYFVLVGTTAPSICKALELALAPWKLQAFAALAVLWPLCALRDISALAPASLFALTVYSLLALTSVSALVLKDDFYTSDVGRSYNITQDLGAAKWFPDKFGFDEISKFPTIVMAFTCQYALLPILANVRSGSSEDMRKVCAGGMGAAYLVYALVAVCAYLAYEGHTRDMVLLNFRHCYRKECAAPGTPVGLCGRAELLELCEDGNAFITLLSGLSLLAVLLGYPCTHFALRRAQLALLFGVDFAFSWPWHYGLAALNIGLTLSVALFVGSKISVVFNWSGAVAGPLISFILPSLFYFRILGKSGWPLASPQRLAGLAGLACGCFVMCLGIACNLLAER